MDVKAYLDRARRADKGIEALLERKKRYEDIQRRRGCGSKALAALEEEIDRRIDEYAALVLEAEAVIDGVEDAACRDVLRFRYLNGWSWQGISERTHYSKDWLWRLHARGLEAAEKKMGAFSKDDRKSQFLSGNIIYRTENGAGGGEEHRAEQAGGSGGDPGGIRRREQLPEGAGGAAWREPQHHRQVVRPGGLGPGA